MQVFEWRLWRHGAAIGVVAFGLASLTALTVVASLRDVDSLSVVALTLAILAFLLQVIIYIGQTASTAQLNLETGNTLTEVQQGVAEMRNLITKQFDYLLKTVVERTVEEVEQSEAEEVDAEEQTATVEASVAISDFDRLLRENVRRLLSEQGVVAGGPPSSPKPTPNPEEETAIRIRQTYPSQEEAERAFQTIRQLSPLALTQFRRKAGAELDRLKLGKPKPRFTRTESPNMEITRELIDAGLVRQVPAPSGVERPDRLFTELTDDGVAASRVFTGLGQPPDYIIALGSKRPD